MKYPSLIKTFDEHWNDTLHARRRNCTDPATVAPTLAELQDATHWPRTAAALPSKVASAARKRPFHTLRRVPAVLIAISLLAMLAFLVAAFIRSSSRVPKDPEAQHGDKRHHAGRDIVYWPFGGVALGIVCGIVGMLFLVVKRRRLRELKAHVQVLHLLYVHTKSLCSEVSDHVVYSVCVEDTVFCVLANGEWSAVE